MPTLDGKVTLKVPPGTQSGKVLRVRGRGVPGGSGRNGAKPGDLLVKVEVVVPTELTDEQRAARGVAGRGDRGRRRGSRWRGDGRALSQTAASRPRRQPGGLRDLGGGRADRDAPADAAHLRAQGPARPVAHQRREPALLRARPRAPAPHPGADGDRAQPRRGAPGARSSRPSWPGCARSWSRCGPRRSTPWRPRTASTGATWCRCARRRCPTGAGRAELTDAQDDRTSHGRGRQHEHDETREASRCR